MAWFFTPENIETEEYLITGEDARHIGKSLRMREGEEVFLVTPDGMLLTCEIQEITSESVSVRIISKKACDTEPDVKVTLYQCLSKGEKMETVIQKAVELGVSAIVPVISSRCISRPDEKSLRKKEERWQKIALSAAQQSRRGIVPSVEKTISFEKALDSVKEREKGILFYELGGDSLRKIVDDITSHNIKNVAVFVGSEGGFEESEASLAKEKGVVLATLGKRILRTETAPLAALSAIMCLTGNMD